MRLKEACIILSNYNFPLAGNGCGEEGARRLASKIHDYSALKEVELMSCAIGDQGARNIAWIFQRKVMVQRLFLTENQISDEGAFEIALALKTNSTLTQLGLSCKFYVPSVQQRNIFH